MLGSDLEGGSLYPKGKEDSSRDLFLLSAFMISSENNCQFLSRNGRKLRGTRKLRSFTVGNEIHFSILANKEK